MSGTCGAISTRPPNCTCRQRTSNADGDGGGIRIKVEPQTQPSNEVRVCGTAPRSAAAAADEIIDLVSDAEDDPSSASPCRPHQSPDGAKRRRAFSSDCKPKNRWPDLTTFGVPVKREAADRVSRPVSGRCPDTPDVIDLVSESDEESHSCCATTPVKPPDTQPEPGLGASILAAALAGGLPPDSPAPLVSSTLGSSPSGSPGSAQAHSPAVSAAGSPKPHCTACRTSILADGSAAAASTAPQHTPSITRHSLSPRLRSEAAAGGPTRSPKSRSLGLAGSCPSDLACSTGAAVGQGSKAADASRPFAGILTASAISSPISDPLLALPDTDHIPLINAQAARSARPRAVDRIRQGPDLVSVVALPTEPDTLESRWRDTSAAASPSPALGVAHSISYVAELSSDPERGCAGTSESSGLAESACTATVHAISRSPAPRCSSRPRPDVAAAASCASAQDHDTADTPCLTLEMLVDSESHILESAPGLAASESGHRLLASVMQSIEGGGSGKLESVPRAEPSASSLTRPDSWDVSLGPEDVHGNSRSGPHEHGSGAAVPFQATGALGSILEPTEATGSSHAPVHSLSSPTGGDTRVEVIEKSPAAPSRDVEDDLSAGTRPAKDSLRSVPPMGPASRATNLDDDTIRCAEQEQAARASRCRAWTMEPGDSFAAVSDGRESLTYDDEAAVNAAKDLPQQRPHSVGEESPRDARYSVDGHVTDWTPADDEPDRAAEEIDARSQGHRRHVRKRNPRKDAGSTRGGWCDGRVTRHTASSPMSGTEMSVGDDDSESAVSSPVRVDSTSEPADETSDESDTHDQEDIDDSTSECDQHDMDTPRPGPPQADRVKAGASRLVGMTRDQLRVLKLLSWAKSSGQTDLFRVEEIAEEVMAVAHEYDFDENDKVLARFSKHDTKKDCDPWPCLICSPVDASMEALQHWRPRQLLVYFPYSNQYKWVCPERVSRMPMNLDAAGLSQRRMDEARTILRSSLSSSAEDPDSGRCTSAVRIATLEFMRRKLEHLEKTVQEKRLVRWSSSFAGHDWRLRAKSCTSYRAAHDSVSTLIDNCVPQLADHLKPLVQKTHQHAAAAAVVEYTLLKIEWTVALTRIRS